MSKKRKSAATHPAKVQPAANRNRWLYVNFALAALLILAGVLSLFWMGQQTSASKASTVPAGLPSSGQAAPDFTLTALNGSAVNLSDYAGQVVLVNTWATWCPPCKAEMPTLNAYYETHKAEGFVVLAINSQEDAATVDQFIQQMGFTFPVLLDSRAEMQNLYNVRALPTSFVVDRDGSIVYTHTGEITQQQLDAVIGPLL